jgi:NAD(P)-dependent dehydrogenase (short-subunit alcohol dehydrogenase family)
VQINLLGPHRLAHALLPCLLLGIQPRIVNVSTGAAVRTEIADGGKRMMELLEKPFDVSGKFFHGSEELMF